MRTKILVALVFGLAATSAFAAPQSHGRGGGGMNRDTHGDTVSAAAAQARAGDTRVGPAVSDVAQSKAKGKGVTGATHGNKGHAKSHGKH
ncbi:hypothetical protein [Dyella flagellata]|uniref:Uncharacterized protein n=1 Tax=Dyella flagellata TaxID=1867833 RepID=A0ABQ5X9U9_9GAMM|nr:hypothetical protein [Dyella flagellata]GLQ87426.1 hypothetical protein GCM10007898_09920 [Dyella flagellata]